MSDKDDEEEERRDQIFFRVVFKHPWRYHCWYQPFVHAYFIDRGDKRMRAESERHLTPDASRIRDIARRVAWQQHDHFFAESREGLRQRA